MGSQCGWQAPESREGYPTETDEFGFEAAVDPVHVHDIHATILHLMGMDHELLTYFHQGRKESLTDVHGKVIDGILS